MPTFSKKKAQEYVKSSGGYCPACNSFDIKIGESNWEGNLVSQRITCNKCGCVWEDWFKLYLAKPSIKRENHGRTSDLKFHKGN